MKNKIFFAFMFIFMGLVNAGHVYADTQKSDYITADETWAKEDGPYIVNDVVGISSSGGTTTISHSSIWGNTSGAIASNGAIITATNNWWGDATGPSHASNPGGKGQLVSDGVQFNPWYTDEGMTVPSGANANVKHIKVAMVLSELSDIPHNLGPFIAQPCKLIPEKTYANGYSKEYYTDLLYCVSDYWSENSYGTVDLQFTVLDNGGIWYKLPHDKSYYQASNPQKVALLSDVRALADGELKDKGYGVVMAVHSDKEAQVADDMNIRSAAWCNFKDHVMESSCEALVASDDGVGTFVHEVGHTIGGILTPNKTPIPDLYNAEHLDEWDVMALGSLDEGRKNPSSISAYVRVFLGLLNFDTHARADYGSYVIPYITQMYKGDKVFRYNLSNATESDNDKYYLAEARRHVGTIWDTSTPEDDRLVLTYVNQNGYSMYGYSSSTEEYDVSRHLVTIPGHIRFISSNIDGVLNPNVNDQYNDYGNLISFTASRRSEGTLSVTVKPIDTSFFVRKFGGVVMNGSLPILNGGLNRTPLESPWSVDSFPQAAYKKASILARVYWPYLLVSLAVMLLVRRQLPLIGSTKTWWEKKYWYQSWVFFVLIIPILFIVIVIGIIYKGDRYERFLDVDNGRMTVGEYCHTQEGRLEKRCDAINSGIFEAGMDEKIPTANLHALTSDGRHVGMNYETGQFENQVDGAIVSGPNGGAPEWILLPDGVQAKYYVSTKGIKKYAESHPEVKDALMNATSTYEIYGRYVDPAAGIFTSEILKDQTLKVGTDSVFEVSGTSTPVITPKSTDIIAPEPIFSFATTTQSWVLGANEEAAIATSTMGSSDVQYVITDKAGNTTSFVASILNSSTDAMNIKSMSQNGVISPMATTSITSYTKMTMSEPPTTYVYQNITLGSNWTRIVYNYQNQVSDVTTFANGTSTIVQMPNFQTSIVTFNHGVPTLSLKEVVVPKPQPIDIEIPIDPQPGPAPLE